MSNSKREKKVKEEKPTKDKKVWKKGDKCTAMYKGYPLECILIEQVEKMFWKVKLLKDKEFTVGKNKLEFDKDGELVVLSSKLK